MSALEIDSADITPDTPEARRVSNNDKLDGYRGIWFTLGQFSAYGDKYSGGLGTYTANHTPLAIYAPEVDRTFFVYGGTPSANERQIMIMASYYDHASHTVPKPTVVHRKPGVDDPHDNPSLSIDGNGYIWVFVSGRDTSRPGIVFRSTEPYSTDAFEQKQILDGMTYPQPWFDPASGQFLLMFTQYTGGRELYCASSPEGTTWSSHKKLAGFGGHYQVSNYNRSTGKIGTFFNYHPEGDVNQRTNLYYMESADWGQTWQAANGTPLSLPLNTVSNPALVTELRSQGILQFTCDLNWDASGNPLLLYMASRSALPGPAGDPREWRLTRWNGTEWVTSVITTSTHSYDVGSIHVQGDRWTVVGPTGMGPQQWGSGGEIELWISDDQGGTWTKQRELTHDSELNHGYVRRPEFARDPFHHFWADGNPDKLSESRLYFANADGTRVWQLPYTMTGESATPIEIRHP